MNYHLKVRGAAERVASTQQVAAKFRVVVDFAVTANGDRSILAQKRLIGGRPTSDGKAAYDHGTSG
jgi:hypothetical protein